MTQEQILEGTRAIAIFMGAKVEEPYSHYEGISGTMFYYEKNDSPGMYRNLSISALKYHSSWDWLMPVCVKINRTNTFDTCTDGKYYNRNPYWVGQLQDLSDRLSSLDISKMFEQVVSTIKWYNENKPS